MPGGTGTELGTQAAAIKRERGIQPIKWVLRTAETA